MKSDAMKRIEALVQADLSKKSAERVAEKVLLSNDTNQYLLASGHSIKEKDELEALVRAQRKDLKETTYCFNKPSGYRLKQKPKSMK